MTTNIAIPTGARPPSAVRSPTRAAPPESEGASEPHRAAASTATTATISAAAQALAKEAAVTPAQTAQEAQGNDHQAQRLLAKQAAAQKAYS